MGISNLHEFRQKVKAKVMYEQYQLIGRQNGAYLFPGWPASLIYTSHHGAFDTRNGNGWVTDLSWLIKS